MLGYNVTAVNNSRKALRLLAQTPDQFDLLITDMTMPNMSGDRLAVEAKKIKPQIPIILCTGFSKKMSKEKARAIGIDAFLMKPVALEDMAETIRVVLG
jgi:CheY-like chemotaxis protein